MADGVIIRNKMGPRTEPCGKTYRAVVTYLLTNFPTPWQAVIHLLMSGKTPPTQVAETSGKL